MKHCLMEYAKVYCEVPLETAVSKEHNFLPIGVTRPSLSIVHLCRNQDPVPPTETL